MVIKKEKRIPFEVRPDGAPLISPSHSPSYIPLLNPLLNPFRKEKKVKPFKSIIVKIHPCFDPAIAGSTPPPW